MAWALWLSVPVVATVLAAVWAWLRGRPARRLDTPESMQAHRDYLDALTVPARGAHRVSPPVTSGTGD
ncbi:MAG: hypothetical protein ACRDWT_09850 [Jatrophihabitantaceae bacterium]